MKREEVAIGNVYAVRVSGQLSPVQIIKQAPYGGWLGRNLLTRRPVRIRSARRLGQCIHTADEVHLYYGPQSGGPQSDDCQT